MEPLEGIGFYWWGLCRAIEGLRARDRQDRPGVTGGPVAAATCTERPLTDGGAGQGGREQLEASMV